MIVTGRYIAEFALRKLVCHVLEFAIYKEVVLSNEVAARKIANNYMDSSASLIKIIDLLSESFIKEALIYSFPNIVRNIFYFLV